MVRLIKLAAFLLLVPLAWLVARYFYEYRHPYIHVSDYTKKTQLTKFEHLCYNQPMKHTNENLANLVEIARQNSPQVIKVRDAVKWWGLRSTSHAEYLLRKMAEVGFVEYVPTGKKGEWRLA